MFTHDSHPPQCIVLGILKHNTTHRGMRSHVVLTTEDEDFVINWAYASCHRCGPSPCDRDDAPLPWTNGQVAQVIGSIHTASDCFTSFTWTNEHYIMITTCQPMACNYCCQNPQFGNCWLHMPKLNHIDIPTSMYISYQWCHKCEYTLNIIRPKKIIDDYSN